MDSTQCTVSTLRKITLTTLATLLLVVGVFTERWFYNPQIDPVGQADAIFVLGGGAERVEFALDLAPQGIATDVVFASEFVGSENVWAARPCNDVRPANVPDHATFRCFEPEPGTTRGEARLLRGC
jgi:hypothetical protein